jgi:hypothetical protein
MAVPSASLKHGPAKTRAAAADRLFVALDQHRIDGDPDGSVVEVLGIHPASSGVWVQIALAGQPDLGAIFHLPARATIDQAIAAIDAWGAVPWTDRPRLVRVMQLA